MRPKNRDALIGFVIAVVMSMAVVYFGITESL